MGFIGPGPIESHWEHAEGFRVVQPPPQRALDLGSGGGMPGLVLALGWPTSTWVLLDANQRRTAFLEQAIGELGLQERVVVRRERAEVAGHDPDLRQQFDLVVARGFGPPAVTAECAAAFLQVSGLLLVSEPPTADAARWPELGLDGLGLADEGIRGGVRRLRQIRPAPPDVPRRTGAPAKHPHW